MSRGWEPCPRCGSKKVQTLGKSFWFLTPLGSGSCLFWVGLFIWPVLIFAIPLILFSPLAFLMPRMNQCRDCKNSWKVKAVKEKMKQPPLKLGEKLNR